MSTPNRRLAPDLDARAPARRSNEEKEERKKYESSA
jgi:hypothetical protein